MTPTANLVELVNLWHAYEKTHGTISIADFCRLYLAQQEPPSPIFDEGPEMKQKEGIPLLNRAGILFGRLTRFGLMYSKKALTPAHLYNALDFNFLRTLNEYESLKKSELIYLSITDFTTGIEVIKRLTKNKYAEEFPDLQDKRSTRIKITPVGQEILFAGLAQIKKVAPVFFGQLSEDEIYLLLRIFQKLNHYHTAIFKDVRNAEFEEIMEKFGNSELNSL